MATIRARARRWALLLVAAMLPLGFGLGRSDASGGSSDYRALASVGETGAIALRDDGAVLRLGDASPLSMPSTTTAVPVVDTKVTATGTVAVLRADGSVSFDAGVPFTCATDEKWWPAVSFALTADGRGAWMALMNGTVISCGTAPDIGPTTPAFDAPVVAIAETADGAGYYLLTARGVVLPFGSARRHGEGVPGGSRFVSMAATADGYWLARADGAVQSFGDAPTWGNALTSGLAIVDLATTPSRRGFRLLGTSGDVVTFGPVEPMNDALPIGGSVARDTFEDGESAWVSWWGPPRPRIVNDARSGTAALLVPGHWSTFGNITRTVEGLRGGHTYRLSYWVKGNTSVGGEFNWSPPDWSVVVSGRLPSLAITAERWSRVSVDLTAPTGAERLWLGLYADADFVLDDVTLVGPVDRPPGGVSSSSVSSGSSSTLQPATTAAGTTSATTTPTTPPPESPGTLPAATLPTTTRPLPTTSPPTQPTTTVAAPVPTTLPPAPVPTPRVGRPPSGPDEIDARVCGSSRLLGGPISAGAAGALYVGRSVVTVPAGDNSGAFSGGAGTVYWLAPGRHTLGSSPFGQIQPKDDDVYIGAPGAVLDGAATNRYAFVGHAQRVAIRYLTITGFDAPVNEGVVNHDSGDHWLIEFSTIRANGGGGMMAGSGQVVRQSCLAENGQYGFNAYQGGDGITDVVFDHNEIMGNNTGDWEVRQPGCGCTGGGKFWAVKGARITNNWVHDNHSVGLWADTNNIDFLFERNVVDHNDNVGIWYEISYNARIVDNLLTRNGWVSGRSNQGAPAPAIYLSESGGDSRLRSTTAGAAIIEIAGNQLVDNFSGITLYENTNRFCNSNGNSSTGYCTPFVGNGKIPAPQQYGYGQPINPSHQCTAPGIASEPLYTDCRWRTQHVSIHDNALAFNPSVVPCAGKFCGAMSLYGSGADNQAWQPYTVSGTLDALSFGQDNRWRNNTYQGPWKFMTRFGDQVDLATWRGTYAQDQGSSFG